MARDGVKRAGDGGRWRPPRGVTGISGAAVGRAGARRTSRWHLRGRVGLGVRRVSAHPRGIRVHGSVGRSPPSHQQHLLPCSLHRWRWQIRAMWWQDGDGRSERSQRAPGNPTLQRPWPQAALAGVRQAAHLCSRQTPALHAVVHLMLALLATCTRARAGAGQRARRVAARAVAAAVACLFATFQPLRSAWRGRVRLHGPRAR